MEKWYEYESIANDYDELEILMEKYRKIYDKHHRLVPGRDNPEIAARLERNERKLDEIKDVMEYLIMRLAFINPMHLPAMTECYLRKDFHFAMYLGYCYGKVLMQFFKWSLYTTLILFGVVIFCNLMFEVMADDMILALL